MIGILGKKVGMTQIFKENGAMIPVTLIEAGPCSVLQIKTAEKDGYLAVQLGFGRAKENRLNKAGKGHFKKSNSEPKKFIKEMRSADIGSIKVGDSVTVDMLQEGDIVNITSISKGKGFQGGVKRWGWHGGDAGHGSMHHRRVGSIGQSSFPSRVHKGHEMPGHMGARTTTVRNLEVIKVDKTNNLVAIKGSVPGWRNGYLVMRVIKKAPASPPPAEAQKKESKETKKQKK